MRLNERSGRWTEGVAHELPVLQNLEAFLRDDGRPILVVSDFDETLCHKYAFNPATNNHDAIIDVNLAKETRKLPLVLATATRAIHPKLRHIRQSGMLAPGAPLLAENGGVILGEDGSVLWSVVDSEAIDELHTKINGELPKSYTLPSDMQLVAKRGLTLLVVRAQKLTGKGEPRVQAELREALQGVVGDEWLVVDGGRSLSVQRPETSKTNGLGRTGLRLDDYCVISLGDGANDVDVLAMADVGISVGERIAEYADIVVEPDTTQVTSVMKTIGRVATGFEGWTNDERYLLALS